MTNTLTTYRRRGGVTLLTGAALTVASCICAAVSQATAHVSTDLWRAPLSHNAAIEVALLGSAANALTVAGVAWLWRSRLPLARSAMIGLGAVIAGTAILFACQVASIAVVDQLNTTTATSWVWCGFAVSSLLVVFGMIAAGLSISARAVKPTWRDHAPLICGLFSLMLLPLGSTDTAWVGIAVYALGYFVLGVALLTVPTGRHQTVAQAT